MFDSFMWLQWWNVFRTQSFTGLIPHSNPAYNLQVFLECPWTLDLWQRSIGAVGQLQVVLPMIMYEMKWMIAYHLFKLMDSLADDHYVGTQLTLCSLLGNIGCCHRAVVVPPVFFHLWWMYSNTDKLFLLPPLSLDL